jgi:hypothetical protein
MPDPWFVAAAYTFFFELSNVVEFRVDCTMQTPMGGMMLR